MIIQREREDTEVLGNGDIMWMRRHFVTRHHYDISRTRQYTLKGFSSIIQEQMCIKHVGYLNTDVDTRILFSLMSEYYEYFEASYYVHGKLPTVMLV